MANRKAYGFQPHAPLDGRSSPDPEVFQVATGYQAQDDGTSFSVDLNIGDPVKLVNDGSVALALTTQPAYGIIVSCPQVYDAVKGVVAPAPRVPGATAWGTDLNNQTLVSVVRADSWVFRLQADENTTATTEAAYNALRNQNISHTCVGDTTAKIADPLAGMSTANTTAGLTWRIVGTYPGVDQKFDETFVTLLVTANLGQSAGQAATTIAGV